MAVITDSSYLPHTLDVGSEEHAGSCAPAESQTPFNIQPPIFATVNTTALGVYHSSLCFSFISDFQVVMSEILCSAFQTLCKL